MKNRYLISIAVLLIYVFNSSLSTAQCNADAGPDIDICLGTAGTIGGSPTGGPGAATYSWSPAAGLNNPNIANPTANPATTTTYTVTVTVGGNSCTDQVTVTVNPVPNADFNFGPNNQCSNVPVSFLNNSTGNGLTYSWDFDNPGSNGNTSSALNPSHEFYAPGSGTQSFNVTLTVTDANGCSDNHIETVTVNQSPDPVLMDPFSSFKNCDGSPFDITLFDNSTPTSNANYQIIWGDGSADFTGATFPGAGVMHTYAPGNIYNLLYIITGTNGCIDTTEYLISNITNPAVGVANPGNTNGCGPLNLCFPISGAGGNHNSTIYTVDYGDGSPIDTFPHPVPPTICHTYTESSCGAGGAFTFTITAINSCDQSVATVNPVRVYTGPEAHFSAAPNPACVNTLVNFTNTSIEGFNNTCSNATFYQWDFGDGTTANVFNNAPQTHTYTTPGTYTVSLTASNSCGNSTETHTICIEAAPVPDFSITPKEGCLPLNVQSTNLTSAIDICDTTNLWTVTFNGSPCNPATGTFNFINGTDQNSINPEFEFLDPGEYIITLSVTNACGTFTHQDTVNVYTIPEIDFPPLGTICEGQAVSPIATFNDCDNPITSYNWTFPGGTPGTFNGQTPGSVTFNTAGTPTITVAATNSCGTANASQNVTVNAAPAIPTIGSNAPICEGDTLFLTSNAVAGGTYSWTGPNAFTSNLEDPFIPNTTAANSGAYQLVIDNGGCPSQPANLNVTIDPAPVVTVIPSPATICEGDTVSLTASGATTYTWSPATGLSATTGATVDAFPSSTIVYDVTGTTGGCDHTIQVTVNVNPLPLVDGGPDTTLCNQPVGEQLIGTPAGGSWSGPNITTGGIYTPAGVVTEEVFYSFTDGNGCTQIDTVQVNVIDPAIIALGNDTSVCLTSAILNLSASPAGGTWTGTNVSSGGAFTPATVGVNTLTYTFGSGSCTTSEDIEITVLDLPVVDAGLDETICIDNGILVLNGSPAGGGWSGSVVTAGGNFDPTLSGAGTFTVNYSYTDATTGCNNDDNLDITVNDLPLVNAGNDTTACNQPVAIQLTGTPVGGNWSGPHINAGGQFTPAGIGTFTVYYDYTDGNNCSNLDSLVVTVVDPIPADAGNDTTVCIDAGVFTLNGSPNGGNWSGTGVISNDFDPGVSGAGVHTVTYSVGVGSCLTTDNKDITVHDLPVVDAGADFDICLDANPLNLSGMPVGGTWSGNGITNPTGEFTAMTAGLGLHTLYYTYQDPVTGCNNIDSLVATVNALPIVSAGNDTTLCNQAIPVQFNGSPAGGIWSGPNMTSGGQFTPSGIGTFTVTYTYSLASGCSANDDMVITVVDPVQADAGPDVEFCINEPTINLGGLPAGGTWTGTNVLPNGDYSPITSGIFILDYSIGAGNCLTTDQIQVTVHDLPTVNAGLDQDFCISEPAVNFSGTPAGGTWSGVGITDPVLGTFDPATAGNGTHNIIYSYTDPVTTCLNTDTLLATVNPLPVPSFTNNPIACVGIAENFNNTSLGASSYQWDFGDGNGSIATNPSHTYNAIGTYTIQLIASSGTGCLDSISGTIDVMEPPTANFTVAPDSGCAPLNVAFTDLSSGQSISYSWNFGNGNTSNLANPANEVYQQGVLADSIYYIQLDVTNFCGTVSHTDSVQVMPSPTAIFGTNVNTGCSPLTLDFSNSSLGLPDTYFWDFGDGTTSNTSDSLFNHTFTTGASDTTYTIMLVVENECGSDTAYHTITVLPNSVTAFFNADQTVGCEPLTVNFTQFSQSSTFYSWDFGDGNVSTLHDPTHTFVNPGTYNVQLFVNDGCSYDTASVSITVNPSPVVDFTTAPDSVCVNQDFTFTNLSVGLASVDWDFGDGNTSTLSNPNHSYISSGTYNVTLTGTSLTNGCTASITKPVVVRVNPIADFNFNPPNGCYPLPVNFTNTSSNATFYEWYFGDGNSSVNTSPNHTYGIDGNFVITLVATHLNGCTDTTQQNITVYPVPSADFDLSQDSSCYIPVTVNFTNNSTGAVAYAWDFDNGQTSALTDPTTDYTTTGTYSIELVASNQFGCTDTMTKDFTVYPLPIADFTISGDTACALQAVNFTNNSTFGTNYVWDFGDGNTSTDANPSHEYTAPGNYIITLHTYGLGGCGDTVSLSTPIVVHPSPTADFSYVNVQNPDPLSGTVEYTNLSSGALSYEWWFGSFGTSTDVNPIFRFYQIGEFSTTLVATNEFGCTDTIVKNVIVDYFKGLHIPNAMYPGHNSFEVANFIPKGVGLESYHIGVYDAWGNLLWESSAIDTDGRPTEYWDGTFEGVPMPQDAYVWKVEATFRDNTIWQGKKYSNGSLKRSGTVTILR